LPEGTGIEELNYGGAAGERSVNLNNRRIG